MLKRSSGLLLLLGVMLGLLAVGGGQTQQAPRPPVVGLVFDNENLRTASPADVGEDGITRLVEVFEAYGVQIERITLDEAIPRRIDLVVVIRPQTAITPAQTARLWLHLERGGNLLLALDPNGFERIRTNSERDGTNTLFQQEYGLGWLDAMLARPSVSKQFVQRLENAHLQVEAESSVVHPIVEPLVAFQIPVLTWGARPLTVAFDFTLASAPLLQIESAYGESNARALNPRADDPLQLDLAEDYVGRLLVAGVSEQRESGSRMAIVGDGEIFQNLYGFLREGENDPMPRYPGNAIFVNRLLGWLLELPEQRWLPLPRGFTWLGMDGDLRDWQRYALPGTQDAILDAAPSTLDIQRVRAFYNEHFMYLALDTTSNPLADTALEIVVDQGTRYRFSLGEDGAVQTERDGEPVRVRDAAYRLGSGVELRLPRRLFVTTQGVQELCLTRDIAEDCVENTINVPFQDERDPDPLRAQDDPVAIVRQPSGANLRTFPSLNGAIIRAIPNGTAFVPIGRTGNGEWLLVEDATQRGWMAQVVTAENFDIFTLPIVQTR